MRAAWCFCRREAWFIILLAMRFRRASYGQLTVQVQSMDESSCHQWCSVDVRRLSLVLKGHQTVFFSFILFSLALPTLCFFCLLTSDFHVFFLISRAERRDDASLHSLRLSVFHLWLIWQLCSPKPYWPLNKTPKKERPLVGLAGVEPRGILHSLNPLKMS